MILMKQLLHILLSSNWGHIVLPVSVCLSVRPSVCPKRNVKTLHFLLQQNYPKIILLWGHGFSQIHHVLKKLFTAKALKLC